MVKCMFYCLTVEQSFIYKMCMHCWNINKSRLVAGRFFFHTHPVIRFIRQLSNNWWWWGELQRLSMARIPPGCEQSCVKCIERFAGVTNVASNHFLGQSLPIKVLRCTCVTEGHLQTLHHGELSFSFISFHRWSLVWLSTAVCILCHIANHLNLAAPRSIFICFRHRV